MVDTGFSKSSEPLISREQMTSLMSLVSLNMLKHHGVIPTNAMPKFVEFKLVEIYTWDVGIRDKVIPFAKLTERGRKSVKRAYREMKKEPEIKRALAKDFFLEREKWPDMKFLMGHQRFLKERDRLGLEVLEKDYHTDFPVS